jgi:hypothetical protein
MLTLRKIRLTAALALICAMCLPLSQCSKQKDARHPQATKSISQQLFPRSDDLFSYEYAVSELGFTPRGALTLLAFTWPILFIVIGSKLSEWHFSWILYLLELLLCGGTIYWLCGLTLFGGWLYGAYVVFVSIVIFGCTALISLFYATRTILIRRRSLTQKGVLLRSEAEPANTPMVEQAPQKPSN